MKILTQNDIRQFAYQASTEIPGDGWATCKTRTYSETIDTKPETRLETRVSIVLSRAAVGPNIDRNIVNAAKALHDELYGSLRTQLNQLQYTISTGTQVESLERIQGLIEQFE